MQSPRVHLKIYADSASNPELDAFVPIFHRWIRDRVLSELMIDVVDYKHVHEGPGIVLIGHGSDYYMDQGEGRLGLLYSRKRSGPAPQVLLLDAFRRAFQACNLLEREPTLTGRLRFRTDEALLSFPDRLHVENSAAGFGALRPELETVLAKVYGQASVHLEQTRDSSAPLSVRVTVARAPSLATLLERIGEPAAAPQLRVI
jgi:hypothetical protein